MSAVYLGKYDFCVHDFFCCKTNTVHTAYPLHLIFDFILILPRFFGITGICLSQPAADVLTILVCLCSVKSMKVTASRNMAAAIGGET